MISFAANSLLNRAALLDGGGDPAAFTLIRMISGAAMLGLLVAGRGGARAIPAAGDPLSAAALMLYAGAFSFAYLTLDAGLGALVLFGAVQVTMFAGALRDGLRPPARRWIGAGAGLAGLALLLLPGTTAAPAALGVGLMALAGIGWGIYSLRGQRAGDPLLTTAGNFLWASPLALILWLAAGLGGIDAAGALLAMTSGALASGLGYALWYAALPRLDAAMAGIAQLSVPLIATAGGLLLLGEAPTLLFAAASLLILGGILFALIGPGARA
ncbi:MAG: DMT family transporter [Pseudomonadota bacterium]